MTTPSGKRIVITGMGVVTPIGIGLNNFWNGLVEGRSGGGFITRFDASEHKTKIACEVSDFDPLNFMDKKAARRMDLFCQLAYAAAGEAMEHSALNDYESLDSDRVGVIIGTGIGGMNIYEEQVKKLFEAGPGRVSPMFIPMLIGDIAAGQVSIRWNLKGPNYSVQSACATASHAIGVAMMHLLAGDADAMVCGGAEAPMTSAGTAGFNSMKALSTRNDDPLTASRPFDKDRDGFVMAEGSAIFVLETEEHALKRGAEIYGIVDGYGFSGDAFHLTAPAPGHEGAVRSMRAAIAKAGLKPEDIDYINAHGTSTELNDKSETEAIKTVFGDHANKVHISSTKSMTGHLLGAAGAVELAASTLAIRNNIIPPTINYVTPDPECDLDYTPNKARKADINIAISNTFGFGGHNATMLVRGYDK